MDYRDNKSSYQTNRYNEQVLSYTKAGAVTRLQRRGLKNDGKYGKIDNLHITLKGNRLHYVLDDAENLMYEGAVEFQGDESNGSAFGYNANGGLITDTGKGIMHIDYDDNNYPRRIQFANGNVTEYVYTATGEKLRAVHYTAVPNIEVGSGETHTLTDAEILFKDSTDYHGSLIMENGVPSQYLFDGGYCKLTDGSGNANISYHYYDRDHLGNIRGVIDESGTVEQITNYYPFGAPYSDATTTNPTFQRYKYNGKELELMHGLKWYDYGARWYDPLLVNWNRPDPSHKEYYPWSPYAYCGDNPMNAVDPDGRESLLIIWASTQQRYGHAAFAIQNYTEKYEPMNTYTVYGLFPYSSYSISDAVIDKKERGLFLISTNKTLSQIKSGDFMSGEDYEPDGILKIQSDYEHDSNAKKKLEEGILKNEGYKGTSRNCSTYVREGVREATGNTQISGEERILFKKVVTPNQLFIDTKAQNNVVPIIDLGNVVNYKIRYRITNKK